MIFSKLLANFPEHISQELNLCFCSSASRNVSDWWLAYWISHSRVSNSTAREHVNLTTSYQWNHVIPPVLTTDQLGKHVHIVKDTVTFYLVVYGGLAVANTVWYL